MSKKVMAAVALAGALAIVSSSAISNATDGRMEKCYGVVKAGKNDCASSDGSHSCAGHADADGGKNEWIMLPSGVCDKLVNGSTES